AAPAHRDPGVRQVVDLVVRDRGRLGVSDVDRDAAVVLHRGVVEVVVRDGVAAGVLGRVGRLGDVHSGQVQSVARDVGEYGPFDRVVLRSVAEIEPGRTEVHEVVVVEGDVM